MIYFTLIIKSSYSSFSFSFFHVIFLHTLHASDEEKKNPFSSFHSHQIATLVSTYFDDISLCYTRFLKLCICAYDLADGGVRDGNREEKKKINLEKCRFEGEKIKENR